MALYMLLVYTVGLNILSSNGADALGPLFCKQVKLQHLSNSSMLQLLFTTQVKSNQIKAHKVFFNEDIIIT